MSESHPNQSGSCNPRFGKIYSEEEKLQMSIETRGIKSKHFAKKQGNSSKYFGVSKKNGNWRVRINYDGKIINVGIFQTEIEAGLAWNETMLEYYGWKVKDKLNEIKECEIMENWMFE